ncbi:hypothetical protein [Seonamhaeicola sp.]|uniref:hypothetical protein n=1 Tax=Seonamhaeicola sp. TaxID=1912245 RepID=UPI002624558C|nr:hypothetical protein [Seonamhaeicola sp.]
MSISKRIIDDSLWGEKTEITEEIIDFYRNNPKELDLIIDKEYFHSKFIKFFFVIGVLITVTSRLLKFFFENTWASFINEVVLDVFSELGIAIFGGAITAFILEKLKQKQYQDNLKFREEIIKKINESSNQ